MVRPTNVMTSKRIAELIVQSSKSNSKKHVFLWLDLGMF